MLLGVRNENHIKLYYLFKISVWLAEIVDRQCSSSRIYAEGTFDIQLVTTQYTLIVAKTSECAIKGP